MPSYLDISQASDLRNKHDRLIYRYLEILPATLTWLTFILIIAVSKFFPIQAAIFIIIFDLYWLLKTIYLSLHLRSGFKQTQKNLKINWLNKLNKLDPRFRGDDRTLDPRFRGDDRTLDPRFRGDDNTLNSNWTKIYHLILLPFYNEPIETIKLSMESLAQANYPKDKMIVVLAAEERASPLSLGGSLEKAKRIEEEYKNKFFKFLITLHPANLPDEIPGKGANIAFAAQEAKKKIINPLKIPYENILVSAFDIDTVIYQEYFSRLTYVFLNTPDNQHSSYQPVPFYINNIWTASALSRVVAFSATFWHTLQQERIERLTTFSSHSIPFIALNKVNFWQKNMVSEDSRIFWRLLFKNNGGYKVQPLHFPVKMDANVAPTFRQTIKNIYKQQRRWAWGSESAPYMIFGFLKNKKIPLRKKINWTFVYLEGFWSWSTNSIIIFALGWLPIFLGGEIFRRTLLAYNLPQVTRWLMTLSMIGIITSAYLTMIILPPRPKEHGRFKYFLMIIQWPLLFITMIFFGAIPAIEAQTRLALGGKFRLGFWVTPKDSLGPKEIFPNRI